jgi:dihydrofolate reductase
MTRVSLVAAIGATTRAIGKENKLVWHLPEDLKYFKTLTTGHAVIMGRKTYESIGKPLPNRTNIVVTRSATYKAEGCKVVTSLEDALKYARALTNSGASEVFVIGGADIYTQALPLADRLYLTLVDDPGEGADVFFPEYAKDFKKVVATQDGSSGTTTFHHVTLER